MAAARGLWAVGYVAYEAAPAFDPNLRVRKASGDSGRAPLLWFGLYRTRVLRPELYDSRGGYELSQWQWVDSRAHFEADIHEIKRRIVAGDTYQVNYTSRLRSTFSGVA